MVPKILATLLYCGWVAYEISTGIAFVSWTKRPAFSWTRPPEVAARDEQPVRYWLFVALHTALAGLYVFVCWLAPAPNPP